MRFGILCALHVEARCFGRRGRLFGTHDFRVAVSGPGRENAARSAHALVRDGCEAIVVWGVAGALDPALAAGDLVLADAVCTERGEEIATDAAWRDAWAAHLATVCTVRRGRLLTVSNPVLMGRDKERLHRTHDAAVVDMEASAAAYVTRSARLPLLCLRSVVDPATFDVPRGALAGLDARGRTLPLATLAALWREPQQLTAMLHLLRHFRAARAGLSRAARVLRTPPAVPPA